MRYGPLISNRRVLLFGVASALLLLTLVTIQVALAGPSGSPSATTVGTLPPTNTPIPVPTQPPPAPPAIPTPTLTPAPTSTPIPPADATETPTPLPTAPEPDPAPPVTEAYTWFELTAFEVPVFEPEPEATAEPAPEATAEPAPEATAIPSVALKVPARSMNIGGQPASGQITVKPVKASEVADVSSSTIPDKPTLQFTGRSVEIDVFGLTATSGDASDITGDVRFNPPLEIGFDITDEEWEANEGIAGSYEVRYFSVQENRWVALAGEVDPFPPRRVTAKTTHLTSFALFVASAPVPEAPDGGDYSLGIGGAGLIGLFGATLIIVGFYVRRKAAARI